MNVPFSSGKPDAAAVDLTGAECIAFTSTAERGKPRWTELSIHYKPHPSGVRFHAEVTGRSTMRGEHTKRRAVYVGSLARALQHFDQDSDATNALRIQALDWEDRNRERIAGDVEALRELERGQVPGGFVDVTERGYKGSTLLQAVSWLYGDAQAGKAQRLAEDFGVPRRTVSHALDQEAAGHGLTGWAKAFVSALAFFDRAAWAASKGTGNATAS